MRGAKRSTVLVAGLLAFTGRQPEPEGWILRVTCSGARAETSNLIEPAGQNMSQSKTRKLVLSGSLTAVWMVHLSHLLTVAAAGGQKQTEL